MNESTGYTNSDSFALILVHMIDDCMTLSDPVEELRLFASKETLARCLSGQPHSRVRMEEAGCSKSGAFIWTVTVRYKQPKILITSQKEEKDKELVSRCEENGQRLCFQLQISYRSENHLSAPLFLLSLGVP
ncbi:hypothetical protein ILYODFUR_019060 [Ilyodon furcidens]|uniref:Uncharacterized protein n=1 Tax=Ilyodon furcidens TaxID=33524 RepID=A0ABV0T9P3_9TELE